MNGTVSSTNPGMQASFRRRPALRKAVSSTNNSFLSSFKRFLANGANWKSKLTAKKLVVTENASSSLQHFLIAKKLQLAAHARPCMRRYTSFQVSPPEFRFQNVRSFGNWYSGIQLSLNRNENSQATSKTMCPKQNLQMEYSKRFTVGEKLPTCSSNKRKVSN